MLGLVTLAVLAASWSSGGGSPGGALAFLVAVYLANFGIVAAGRLRRRRLWSLVPPTCSTTSTCTSRPCSRSCWASRLPARHPASSRTGRRAGRRVVPTAAGPPTSLGVAGRSGGPGRLHRVDCPRDRRATTRRSPTYVNRAQARAPNGPAALRADAHQGPASPWRRRSSTPTPTSRPSSPSTTRSRPCRPGRRRPRLVVHRPGHVVTAHPSTAWSVPDSSDIATAGLGTLGTTSDRRCLSARGREGLLTQGAPVARGRRPRPLRRAHLLERRGHRSDSGRWSAPPRYNWSTTELPRGRRP